MNAMRFVATWFQHLSARVQPVRHGCEVGVVSVYDPTADDIADEIRYPGRRHKDERRFRLELGVYLEEEIMLRERYVELLERLLLSERR